MFLQFFKLEIKNFLRSPRFASGLAMKILLIIFYVYIAFLFIGASFALFFGSKESGQNPILLFSRYFLIYWLVDLLLKYFIQQLPTENIKPLLTQNISKNKISAYTLIKILLSFFSWSFMLFSLPFMLMLLVNGTYNAFGILCFVGAVTCMVFNNTFVNTIINKSNLFLYLIMGSIAIIAVLSFYKIIDLLKISETIIYGFYLHPILAIIPFSILILTGFFTFKFIKENLYLDKGLELKKSKGKTENIAFLNQFGAVGTFINNDVRLIKRSKAARSAVYGGLFFLFYGLFFLSGSMRTTPIFPGLFITGGFMMMFGQRVPAWDSSYYPLMMTLNVPYKEYLKGKWFLLVLGTFISMILAVGYGFFMGWDYYFTIFAAGLYNLGVNAHLTLLSGAFNKKPIDLNSTSKGFTNNQNNFNLKLILLTIPQYLLPVVTFLLVKYFFGMLTAVIVIGILGLIGFLLRDKIFDQIVKLYKTQKYSTLSSFKKID